MKTIALLGGAGFLGLAAAAHMASIGWRPIIFDVPRRLSRGAADLRGFEIVALTEEFDLAAALADIDAAVLLAWASTPARSMLDLAEDLRGAVLPAVQMAMAARAVGVPRFVFISSGGAVYGRAAGEPVDDVHPHEPISVCTERSATTRVANPVGPYQLRGTPVGVVGSIVTALPDERPIPVFGDGWTVRDYIDIADAVEAIVIACDPQQLADGLFNVGAGRGHSIMTLIDMAAEASGVTPQIEFMPARPVPGIVLSNSKVFAACGWRPKISVTESVGRIWAASHGDQESARQMESATP